MEFLESNAQPNGARATARDLRDDTHPALAERRALVVGVGGLGCSAAVHLARSGVGTIGLADDDVVDLSNLARQVLHSIGDLGRSKVDSAADALEGAFPRVRTERHEGIGRSDADELCRSYDFVIDATDDPRVTLELHEAAWRSETPFSYAGAVRFEGLALTVLPRVTACLGCAFPELSGNEDEELGCREAGILGPVAGLFGALQAEEAIRFFGGTPPRFADKLFSFDARSFRAREIRIATSPECRNEHLSPRPERAHQEEAR